MNKVCLFLLMCFFTINSKVQLKYMDADDALSFIKKHLPSNPVILEAGGYDGTDTLKMKSLWPNSTIYVFEPNPQAFKLLKNKTHNCAGITVFDYALSSQNGKFKFYISEFKGDSSKPGASSSLLAPKDHLSLAPFVVFPRKIEVDAIALDDWAVKFNVPQIDFFWLDLQGSELDVLKGASSFIRNTKLICLEVELVEAYKDQPLYKEVKEWLEGNGFKEIARDFLPNELGKNWFGNSIFINKNL